jgi:hypothetical protein
MSGSKGSWSKTQEAMENHGSSTYLRLENDVDKAVVAFCGAPFSRDLCFNEAAGGYEAWNDDAKAAGRKKLTRYAMNVYVISHNGKPVGEMKVFEMNFSTMTTVFGVKDKYTLSRCLFEVTRHGVKGNTKTQYQILPDKDITAEQRAVCGSSDPKDPDAWVEGTIKLIDLEEATSKDDAAGGAAVTDDIKRDGKDGKGKNKTTNGTAAAAAAAPANTNAAAPATSPAATTPPATAPAPPAAEGAISKAAVDEIIGKLKPLDKDKGLTPFLAKFPYAKKISEIHVFDEPAARAYAAQLAAPPAPAATEDPFS